MSSRTSQNTDGTRSDGREFTIPDGVVARASAMLNRLRDNFDGWFGPLHPLPPVAPPGTRPRVMDYPTGANISSTPRATEVISFDQLRRLSENYDLMRLVIETRKDQIARRKFQFSVKRDDEESKSDHKKRNAKDTRIAFLEMLFRKPDGENSWRDWIRMVADDMLVTDAVSILPRFLPNGALFGFDVIDGATIRRVIDNEGKTPQYPDCAYQQVLKGVPAINLVAPNALDVETPQLVYRPRNKRTYKIYGYSPVEQVIMTVNIALRRQVHQLNYYTEGTVPDTIVGVPTTWTPEQIAKFEALWDNKFLDPAQRRKVHFVPGGMDITLTKGDSLKDEMDDWLARVVAFAFSIPPNALIKQMNRASGEQMADSAMEEGLEPALDYITDVINDLIVTYTGWSDIEGSFVNEQAIDPNVQSEIHDRYLKNGTLKVNEVREDLGRDPLDIDFPNAIYTLSGATTLEDALTTSNAQAEQAANPPEPPSAPGSASSPPKGGKAGAVKKKYLRVSAGTVTTKMRKRISVVRGRITKFFQKEKKRIAKVISQRYADVAPKTDKSAAGDKILESLDLDSWTSEMQKALGDELVTIFLAGAKDALTEVAVDDYGAVFNLLEEHSKTFAEEESAALVTRVTATTREKIRQLVENAIVDGMTPAELSKAIQDSVAFSEYRSEMIARTELAKANVAGNVEAWLESGVVADKRWVLGSEHDEDDICDENADDGDIGVKEAFSSGDDYPPAHPNCVCDVIAITKADEED